MSAAAYDVGYRSVGLSGRVWGREVIVLHLGWLRSQLAAQPSDELRRGRYDALCDLLVEFGPLLAPAP